MKRGLIRESPDGQLQLTLEHKRDILLNNIFGVDLDAQAVEVAQLSLYLKLLEEETAATVQPKLGSLREQLLASLHKNIVHGNSLIDWDIQDTPLFVGGVSSPTVKQGSADDSTGQNVSGALTEVRATDTLRRLNPLSFESTFPEVFANGGFDAIVGNPPYLFFTELSAIEKQYFVERYTTYAYRYDKYGLFIEKSFANQFARFWEVWRNYSARPAKARAFRLHHLS